MRKRDIHIGIRVTPQEYAQLKEKIRESGLSQREYLLRAALDKEIINTDGIREILPEMKRQGVNLNQIAKKINLGELASYVELQMTLEEVRDTWRLLKQRLRILQ